MYKIMIVDDDPLVREPAIEYFRIEKWNVEGAADGYEALAKLDRSFDAIVLDLQMPKMDGHEVLRRIQRNRDLRGLSVIILTAYGTIPDAVAAVRSRAFTFLEKPVQLEKLPAILRAAIAWQRVHLLRSAVLAGTTSKHVSQEAAFIIQEAMNPAQQSIQVWNTGRRQIEASNPATDEKWLRVPICEAGGGEIGAVTVLPSDGPKGKLYSGLEASWSEILSYVADLIGIDAELSKRAERIKEEIEKQWRPIPDQLRAIRERIAGPSQILQAQLDQLVEKELSEENISTLSEHSRAELRRRVSLIRGALFRLERASELLGRVPMEVLIQKKAVDVVKLVESEVSWIEADAARQKVQLRFESNENVSLMCSADAQQLSKVIQSLLRNSMDAINDRRMSILDHNVNPLTQDDWIEVRVSLSNGITVRIEVEDSGAGIAEEILPKLFTPLMTTKNDRDRNGLELFTAKRIVEQHGGTITPRNSIHGGALFTIDLPKE